jgi:hypothetical protein
MPVVTFANPITPPPFAGDELAVTAWGAGVVDAEGCVMCSHSKGLKRKVPHVHSQVHVWQSLKGVRLLRTLSMFFGGNVVQNSVTTGNWTALFTWGLYGKNMVEFLRRIEPHLVLKCEQARLVIELEERRRLDGGPNKPRSPEFIAYAERVVEKMHELNWIGAHPRELSDHPNNPKRGGRPIGVKNGSGQHTAIVKG